MDIDYHDEKLLNTPFDLIPADILIGGGIFLSLKNLQVFLFTTLILPIKSIYNRLIFSTLTISENTGFTSLFSRGNPRFPFWKACVAVMRMGANIVRFQFLRRRKGAKSTFNEILLPLYIHRWGFPLVTSLSENSLLFQRHIRRRGKRGSFYALSEKKHYTTLFL